MSLHQRLHQTLANGGKLCRLLNHSSADEDESSIRGSGRTQNPMKPNKKALPAVFANKASKVERKGFEPSTSALRTQQVFPAELPPQLVCPDGHRRGM